MDINVNHPNFIVFLDNVTNTILTHVTTNGYFSLPLDKQISMQYIVFKLLKTSLRIKGKMSDSDLKSFTIILCKKNEESENYELAAILNDIVKNFDTVNEKTNTIKQVPIKTTKEENKT